MRALRRGRPIVDLTLPDELVERAAAAYRLASKICATELMEELAPWVRLNTRADANLPIDLANYLARVRKKLADAGIGETFESIAKAIDSLSFKRLMRVPGINASGLIPGGRAAIQSYRATNARLIESVPEQVAKDVGTFLSKTDVRDLHGKALTAQIQARFAVSTARAELWGRDQTLKLYANVNQERQRAAGAKRYQWGTSDDERVRGNPGGLYPSGGDHFHLNGQTFDWAAPPIVDPRTGKRAHPGEDYQCRCTAYPIFD